MARKNDIARMAVRRRFVISCATYLSMYDFKRGQGMSLPERED
jgi:hypothetical protein